MKTHSSKLRRLSCVLLCCVMLLGIMTFAAGDPLTFRKATDLSSSTAVKLQFDKSLKLRMGNDKDTSCNLFMFDSSFTDYSAKGDSHILWDENRNAIYGLIGPCNPDLPATGARSGGL